MYCNLLSSYTSIPPTHIHDQVCSWTEGRLYLLLCMVRKLGNTQPCPLLAVQLANGELTNYCVIYLCVAYHRLPGLRVQRQHELQVHHMLMRIQDYEQQPQGQAAEVNYHVGKPFNYATQQTMQYVGSQQRQAEPSNLRNHFANTSNCVMCACIEGSRGVCVILLFTHTARTFNIFVVHCMYVHLLPSMPFFFTDPALSTNWIIIPIFNLVNILLNI
jgi:hypothetical protein